jgi:hypothetical protein
MGMWQAQYGPVYWYYYTKESNVSIGDPLTKNFDDPPYGLQINHAHFS